VKTKIGKIRKRKNEERQTLPWPNRLSCAQSRSNGPGRGPACLHVDPLVRPRTRAWRPLSGGARSLAPPCFSVFGNKRSRHNSSFDDLASHSSHWDIYVRPLSLCSSARITNLKKPEDLEHRACKRRRSGGGRSRQGRSTRTPVMDLHQGGYVCSPGRPDRHYS
jgi:hypothetical protein